jgi:hypothetical protein
MGLYTFRAFCGQVGILRGGSYQDDRKLKHAFGQDFSRPTNYSEGSVGRFESFVLCSNHHQDLPILIRFHSCPQVSHGAFIDQAISHAAFPLNFCFDQGIA